MLMRPIALMTTITSHCRSHARHQHVTLHRVVDDGFTRRGASAAFKRTHDDAAAIGCASLARRRLIASPPLKAKVSPALRTENTQQAEAGRRTGSTPVVVG